MTTEELEKCIQEYGVDVGFAEIDLNPNTESTMEVHSSSFWTILS